MSNLGALEKKNSFFAFKLRTEEVSQVPFASFPLPKEKTKALYLFALGDESWQGKILDWLNGQDGRKIYFIPENPQMLHTLSPSLMEHPRVKIGNDFRPYAWEHLFKPWELFGGNPKEIADWVLGTELTFCLYNDFGVSLLSNVFQNLSMNEPVKKGESLAGRFEGIPAIVCGAGPSLMDSFEDIRKNQDRALIIGGGSALAPLSRACLPIHFAAALDPDPPTERFYRQNHFEAPLFYQNQLSHTLLKHHHGPKLCLGQSGSFPLEEWLSEELHLSPSDVGWNVSTFSVRVATLLGCNPIFFVGMDLCIYDEASYAEGVEGMDERLNPIQMEDREGKVVYTRPDFLMSKKWLEAFAKEHQEITFVNASTRGLALKGIPDGPLMVPGGSGDLSARVHQSIQQGEAVDFSPMKEKLAILDESIKKSALLLKEMMLI
ncbi:MAG: DUF115 domain-containing protein, partial [Chlamydiia bacterium]|nr:DUF115 domain-containing protein [Chlamydiia bacterium]